VGYEKSDAGTLPFASAPPDEPRLDGARVLDDLRFEFLELGVENDPLDGRTQGFITGLGTLPLDEGQDRFREL
jgi:hypothetical protein